MGERDAVQMIKFYRKRNALATFVAMMVWVEV